MTDKKKSPDEANASTVENSILSLDEPTESVKWDEIGSELDLVQQLSRESGMPPLLALDDDPEPIPLPESNTPSLTPDTVVSISEVDEPDSMSEPFPDSMSEPFPESMPKPIPESVLERGPEPMLAPLPESEFASELEPIAESESKTDSVPFSSISPDSIVPLPDDDAEEIIDSEMITVQPPPFKKGGPNTTKPSVAPPPLPAQSRAVSRPPAPPKHDDRSVKGPERLSIPPLPRQKTIKKPYFGLKITSSLLGQILVDNGFITEAQRDFCLRLQTQSGNFFRIGELAVKQQFMTEDNLALCIQAQKLYVQGIKKEQSRMVRLPEEVAHAELATDEKSTATIQNWLGAALRHGASDLHVMVGQPLVLRHMGKLVRSKQPHLSATRTAEVLESILTEAEKEEFAFSNSVLKCIQLKNQGRARANVFKHMGGMNGVFRLIPRKPPSLVSLNLPSKLAKFTTYSQGLVLITGPTGCGKTSTMAALVDIINRERQNHIITVERPVEYVHRNARSMVSQREVGVHTDGYANALRAALRQDPDVIVIGELNDVHTARLAISAAETGHLVFATLHTDNAVRTVNRVLDIFPPDEQDQIRSMLSESLRGVVCQRLVPRDSEPGLIPVMELLFTTPAMRNLIRDKKVYQLPNAIRMSSDIGNRTFADYANALVSKKEISQDTYELFCREET